MVKAVVDRLTTLVGMLFQEVITKDMAQAGHGFQVFL
jgi:hypothetical protein